MQGPRFRRVLVVDDDPGTRDLLCRTLCGHHQARTFGVESGTAALRVLRQGPIDLIVQDLFRPQGNGFALLAVLRASPKFRRIPVMVVSGHGARYDRRARALGATAVLQKPVSRDELTAAADLVHETVRFREGAETLGSGALQGPSPSAGVSMQRPTPWWRPAAKIAKPLRVWLKRLFEHGVCV